MNYMVNERLLREGEENISVYHRMVDNINDRDVIRRNMSNLTNEKISCYVEEVGADVNKLLEKELSRTITNGKYMRVVYIINAVCSELVITINNRVIDYESIKSVEAYLFGHSETYELLERKVDGLLQDDYLEFGVPGAKGRELFDTEYTILVDGKELVNNEVSDLLIINSLVACLVRYNSNNTNVVLYNINESCISGGSYDLENNKFVLNESNNENMKYVLAVNVVELTEANANFTMYAAPKFPISIDIIKRNGAITSLRIASRSNVIARDVLSQFAQLFIHNINIIENLDGDIEKVNDSSIEQITFDFDFNALVNSGVSNPIIRFREIAKNNLNKVAVVYKDRELTYKEVDEESDALAKKLISLGVKKGDYVIASIAHDEKLIVLLIAILKANAIYVPVDPNYPVERLLFIVEDSKAKFVISDNDLEGKIDSKVLSYSKLVDVACESEVELVSEPLENGYIIYTSGTSGKPKGVLVPSKNIMALINATEDLYSINSNDVWTMFHSYSFDFSVWEMWGCLLTGGKLVVVPRETTRSHFEFINLLLENKVTILSQTPASFYALMKIDMEKKKPQLKAVRLVVFGGEELDTGKLKIWFQRYPTSKCKLANMYGITETTVHTTYRFVHCRESKSFAKSIGKALNGWEISIRNKKGERTLIGEPGEIWVAGEGVAVGYINRDELTQKKFAIAKNGKRYYKSGDLGRFRADGSIDYLGRIDNQVKIRGFRIELDEIRNVLQAINYIDEAVVNVIKADDVTHKQIVAYVKARGIHTYEETVSHLEKKLPVYMIPSKIIFVNEIPMTINGKVDFKYLEAHINDADKVTITTTSESNHDVCKQIWERVLGVGISDDDDFFAAGGNSLLAVELLSEMKRNIDSSIKLKDLYLNSTLRKMKSLLAERGVVC